MKFMKEFAMPKPRLEDSDMPKAYSNRAMPSNEPCNLGHYDHTDTPAYKTPDAVDHPGHWLLDALRNHKAG